MDSVIVTLVTLKWEESGHVSTCVFVLLQREVGYRKPGRGTAEYFFLDVTVKVGEKAEVPLCPICTAAVGAAAGVTGPVC